MPSFSTYYVATEPGKGLFVDGQYYRSRFGKDTLQLMVTDGCFEDRNYEEEECAECSYKQNEIEDICESRDAWKAYAKDLITFMHSEGMTPPELPEELAEED